MTKTPLSAYIDELEAEVKRLTHLHNLDHSLADQREAEIERLRAVVDAARAYVEMKSDANWNRLNYAVATFDA